MAVYGIFGNHTANKQMIALPCYRFFGGGCAKRIPVVAGSCRYGGLRLCCMIIIEHDSKSIALVQVPIGPRQVGYLDADELLIKSG